MCTEIDPYTIIDVRLYFNIILNRDYLRLFAKSFCVAVPFKFTKF